MPFIAVKVRYSDKDNSRLINTESIRMIAPCIRSDQPDSTEIVFNDGRSVVVRESYAEIASQLSVIDNTIPEPPFTDILHEGEEVHSVGDLLRSLKHNDGYEHTPPYEVVLSFDSKEALKNLEDNVAKLGLSNIKVTNGVADALYSEDKIHAVQIHVYDKEPLQPDPIAEELHVLHAKKQVVLEQMRKYIHGLNALSVAEALADSGLPYLKTLCAQYKTFSEQEAILKEGRKQD